MTDIPSRIVMNKPLASGATAEKSNISTDPDSDVLNYDQCFPGVYSTPASNGGRYVQRGDMNAIANISTNDMFRYKCGGINEFDSAQCTAIGGYPKGAILDYVQGTTISKVISLVANNTMNFVTGGIDNIHWAIMNQPEAPMLPGFRLCEIANMTPAFNLTPANAYATFVGRFTAGTNGAIVAKVSGSKEFDATLLEGNYTRGIAVIMVDLNGSQTIPTIPSVNTLAASSWSVVYSDGLRTGSSNYGQTSVLNVTSGHIYAVAYFMLGVADTAASSTKPADSFANFNGITLYIA